MKRTKDGDADLAKVGPDIERLDFGITLSA